MSVVMENHYSQETCDGEGSTISILLFQAVMFAGAIFVDVKHLYGAGFLSRRTACTTLYRRVRALYDLDCEDDQLSVMQSLLLMSYWYEGDDSQKGGRHWIDVCILLARVNILGFDWPKKQGGQWRLRKRLWWCIYTRDKLVALGLQQFPSIEEEFASEIPMITIDDFAPLLLPIEMEDVTAHQDSLRRIYIEKVKVCRFVNRALHQWRYQQNPDDQLLIRIAEANLDLCRQDLLQWQMNLPLDLVYHVELSPLQNQADRILHCHRAWLRLAFLEIRFTVHRQLRALHGNTGYLSHEAEQSLEESLQLDAVQVTDVLQDLYYQKLLYSLPTTSVAVICRTCLTLLGGMNSSLPDSGRALVQRFNLCTFALKQLSTLYGSAVFLVSVLGLKKQRFRHNGYTSMKDILSHIDLDTLSQLTLLGSDYPASTVLSIRDPYCLQVVSTLKLQRDRLSS
ncbi:fungal specific transcription factor domain-containing protein [Aspergillus melleus]|uniref:fungal specific transcription factor domain-containing protein n=1 Tax=Aspergillus melleus TaxID=138277 RepID=UPI001E8E6B39|nr:uncharacterized protein LDX57_006693 [Aspergillus melleus]KAH8429022.1 hypothetical protein LDX57_006693 [Aspergillus melleus]